MLLLLVSLLLRRHWDLPLGQLWPWSRARGVSCGTRFKRNRDSDPKIRDISLDELISE